MEIVMLESKKNRMVFEMKGADHTLCNILRKQLQEDPKVSVATYSIAHPLIGIPKFILETDGAYTPEQALKAAISALEKQNKDVLAKVKAL